MKVRILAFLAACAFGVSAHATVLTFTGTAFSTDNAIIPQSYGDFITGASGSSGDTYGLAGGSTPNISVAYEDASGNPLSLRHWSSGYGALSSVAWSEVAPFQLRLQGDAFWHVTLTSVDLGLWTEKPSTTATVTVRDGNGTSLFSRNDISLVSGQTTTVDFGGLSAETLIVSFQNGPLISADQFGIDNLTFGQISAVPEPSTYAALMGAFVLAGATVWRRRARRG